jgi:hypothetical protein
MDTNVIPDGEMDKWVNDKSNLVFMQVSTVTKFDITS